MYLVPFLGHSTSNNYVTLKSGLGSFKIVENGTTRKLWYGFLFAFQCRPKCVQILYHFRDKARWLKIAIFSCLTIPLYLTLQLGAGLFDMALKNLGF